MLIVATVEHDRRAAAGRRFGACGDERQQESDRDLEAHTN
jgi:hypothetical protein